MKEPKLTDVEVDEKATRQIRQKMAKAKSVKITINIDGKSLDTLRAKASRNRHTLPETAEPIFEKRAGNRLRNRIPPGPA